MHPEGLRPRRAHPAPVAISRSRVCKATTRLQTIDAASSPTAPSAAVSSSIRDQERKSKSALLNTTTSWRKPSDKRTTTMTTRTGRRALVFVMVFGFLVTPGGGDLEPTFARCCALGANWARELLVCSAFPAPVPAISSEHQAICITAANVCCTRFYREKQCQEGMQAAQSGQDCPARTQTGGIFFKDCCDGCQLGLVSGSMGMGCSLRGFQFGFPWDNAYQHCCRSSSPIGTFPALDLIPTDQTLPSPFPTGPALPDVAGGSNALPPIYPEGATLSPEENLCLLFPGQLCGHVCVPTPGSFRCQCRAGFTLTADGKTCIQDSVTDRCQETNPCEHICMDTGVSIECSCRQGFQLGQDERSCTDVDECAEETDGCDRAIEFCVNTHGAFECQPKGASSSDCPAGYKYNSILLTCEDIDECAENSDSCDWSTQTCINSVGSFRCVSRVPTCTLGYRFDEEKRTCVDVDECAREDLHLCSPGEVCVNVHGGYECVPSPNTTLSSTLTTQTSPASTTTTTTTTKVTPKKPEPTRAPTAPEGVTNASQGAGGSQTFTPPPLPPLPPPPAGCPDGFVYNLALRSCRDVDECETNPCDEDERCRNTQGSFSCDCRQGFHRDEQTGDCTDVNECQLGQHTCGRFQRCDNTIGSFTCIRVAGCGTGYTLNHNTGQCEDDDECRLGKDDCHQLGPKWRCVNTKGSFRCERKRCLPFQVLSLNGTCLNATCPAGYTFGPLGCIDINECEGRPCRRNERCLNNEGSYQCLALLDCSAGYRMNDRGTQCVDIDECQLGTHQCHGLQECINRHGGYVCQCPAGYRTNANRVCEDIDECNSYFGSVCSVNAKCENLPGSYRCNCKEGFKDSGDSRSCDDVDECEESSGICHHQCFNTWGSYRCSCNKGYRLGNDTRSCEDVDECSEYRGRGSLCIGLCINTPGSFKCDCPEGYTLAADGRTCQDINECESAGTCRGANELCVNTRGSHVCRELTCPAGYVRDSQHKNRCKKTSLLCRESDEECRRQPLSYSYNFLPLASNLSLPPAGNVDLFTMRGPLWTRTTVQFELDLDSARASPGVTEAARENFHLKRTGFNQAVISLVKPIEGPQEVELSLNMQLYHNGVYSGSAIAKLYIYVTQYEF